MSFLRELFAFIRRPPQILADPDLRRDAGARRTVGADQGFGAGAVRLHSVLSSWRCASSAFQHSITTAPPHLWWTARSSPPRRKSASRAGSTIRDFRRTRFAIAWRRQASRRRTRPRRVLRKAVSQVRAPARDLSRLRAAGLSVVPQGDPGLAEGEAVPERRAARPLREDRRQRRLGERSCCLPTTTRATRHRRSLPRRSRSRRS